MRMVFKFMVLLFDRYKQERHEPMEKLFVLTVIAHDQFIRIFDNNHTAKTEIRSLN
jgi:hypothetical protein